MNVRISIRPHIPESRSTQPKEPKHLLRRYGWDLLVVAVMGVLLYIGMAWQAFLPDTIMYECYAVAFWRGLPTLFKTLPFGQCEFLFGLSVQPLLEKMRASHLPDPLIHFVASQSPDQPFHTFAYTVPATLLFSLGTIAPLSWYQVTFAILMALVAAGIYGLLRHFRSRSAALVYVLYLVIGGWGTAEGRFDLAPSALTLAAIIAGVHKRWHWAFACLALATVFKLYPLVLIAPFLLAQQRDSDQQWLSWRRWTPLATFVAVILVVLVVSLSVNAEITLGLTDYVASNPFQIESVGASILWTLSFLGYPLQHAVAYGDLSVLSPLASQLSRIETVLWGAALLSIWWLQWRGKADLVASCLLTFLVVILTGKVLSPQYLIWVIPLAAYVGEKKLKWILAWSLLGGLTTLIFPYLYTLYWEIATLDISGVPLFFLVIAIRNLVLFCILVSLLFSYWCKQPLATAHKRSFFVGQGMKL